MERGIKSKDIIFSSLQSKYYLSLVIWYMSWFGRGMEEVPLASFKALRTTICHMAREQDCVELKIHLHLVLYLSRLVASVSENVYS